MVALCTKIEKRIEKYNTLAIEYNEIVCKHNTLLSKMVKISDSLDENINGLSELCDAYDLHDVDDFEESLSKIREYAEKMLTEDDILESLDIEDVIADVSSEFEDC